MGTGIFNAGATPAMDWHTIQGVVEILLVASSSGNRDKLPPDGPVGSNADFTKRTDTWPILDRYLADTWPILGRYLADTWPILGRYFNDGRSLHIDRYIGRRPTDISVDISVDTSADYRSTIGRLSVDYRSTIGRLSTDSRPICRPIVGRYIGRDHL